MSGVSYIVAGCRPWARRVFDECLAPLPGRWVYASNPGELEPERLNALAPRYLFFLHWSWKVPADVVHRFECVNFHMTDLPYGRGGSPLQNLILAGHRFTKLSALRMTEELDAGPIYLKETLSLDGRAEDVYLRAAYLGAEMIREIVGRAPTSVPQAGEVTEFRRRRPEDSVIPGDIRVAAVYDFIRMVDAAGYPPACFDRGELHYDFHDAVRTREGADEMIEARVRITRSRRSEP